jgi:hypothetical protein
VQKYPLPRLREDTGACLSALNALDPESYSIAKDRLRTAYRARTPACSGRGTLEGRFSIPSRRRPCLFREKNGGADRDRTDDLRLAKPALSQLSYSPNLKRSAAQRVVGLGRFELPTSRLSGGRSNQTEL